MTIKENNKYGVKINISNSLDTRFILSAPINASIRIIKNLIILKN